MHHKIPYATSVQDHENPWKGSLIIPTKDLKYQLHIAHNHHLGPKFQQNHPMFLYNLKDIKHKVKSDFFFFLVTITDNFWLIFKFPNGNSQNVARSFILILNEVLLFSYLWCLITQFQLFGEIVAVSSANLPSFHYLRYFVYLVA